MNRLKSLIGIAVGAALVPLLAFGQAKVGTTGLNFLKVGTTARAVGMGEAFTAVANDVSALYYNPGGLIQLTRPQATFSIVDWPVGIKYAFLGGVMPMPLVSGVLGVQTTTLFSDEMVETTPEMPYGTGRTFTAGDIAVGLTYCQRLTDKFSVGTTLKYLHSQLADARASGWSADVGTFYATGWRRVNIGMIIQNFGPDMTYVSEPFPLPITFKFGMSMVAYEDGPHSILAAGEFIHPNDNLELYRIGAEYTYKRLVSLRFGKQVNAWERATWNEYQADRQKDPFVEYPIIDENGGLSLDGVSFGLGLQIPQAGVTVDYAWNGLGTLSSAHRFTISYLIGYINF